MPETTPLIKAALNLRVGAGFDVYITHYVTDRKKASGEFPRSLDSDKRQPRKCHAFPRSRHSFNARIFNKKQPFLCKHKGLFFIAYSALISLLSRRLLDDSSNTSRSYCTATLPASESCLLWYSPCFLWLKSVFFRYFSQKNKESFVTLHY